MMQHKFFNSALRVLFCMGPEYADCQELGYYVDKYGWDRFVNDPVRFYLTADEDMQARIWAVIEKRMPTFQPKHFLAAE